MKQPSKPEATHESERSEAKTRLPVTEWPTANSLDRDAPRDAATRRERGKGGESTEGPWQPLGGERADNGND